MKRKDRERRAKSTQRATKKEKEKKKMAHCVSQVFGLLELAFFTFGPAFAFALYFLINLAFIGKRVFQQAHTHAHPWTFYIYMYFIKLMHCSLGANNWVGLASDF